MMIGKVMGAILLAAPLLATGVPPVSLESLVGRYRLLDAGVPAGELEVRARQATSGSFEVVFHLGHPDVTHRTVLYLLPAPIAGSYRVVRWESEPALLDREAEARLEGGGVTFSFRLPTRSGEPVEVWDVWQASGEGGLAITTALEGSAEQPGKVLRSFTAERRP